VSVQPCGRRALSFEIAPYVTVSRPHQCIRVPTRS
jgi:hypothetical protein